jgi:UDP-D-galactose:(glucosyl)LPS alpha-1,6-D-galactosyltransferase
MKILFVWSTLLTSYGGSERVVSNVMDNLFKEGHEVKMVIFDPRREELEDESEWVEPFSTHKDKLYLYFLEDKYTALLRLFVKSIFGINYSYGYDLIANSIKDFMPDLLIVITNPLFISSARKALRSTGANSKIIYWDHLFLGLFSSIKYLSLKQRIETWLASFPIKLKEADGFLVISSGYRDKILSLNQRAKVYTIFNPLKSYGGHLVRRSQKSFFIYVGRLEDRQKNISFLLKGMSHLLDKEWRLKIIGKGPHEMMLKNLSRKLNLSNRIEWAGFKEDPYEGIKEATALLLTSRFEGFGMVLVEANQRGIPVISSNCQAGPSDIVIPTKNGYLYQEGNMDSFVKIMRDVIDNKLTFDTPENIAKTAERFSENKVMKRFIAALNEIRNASK